MKIGPFGIVEIIIILVVILIIFGPKNLPKLGTAIGKTVKNLREGLGGGKKKKEAEEAAKQAEGKEPEELEVVDKPEPKQKPNRTLPLPTLFSKRPNRKRTRLNKHLRETRQIKRVSSARARSSHETTERTNTRGVPWKRTTS